MNLRDFLNRAAKRIAREYKTCVESICRGSSGQVLEIDRSGLFELDFYNSQFTTPFSRNVEAITHFLEHGADANADPNPYFDTKWYKTAYAIELSDGTNPLVDYIRNAQSKRRAPSIHFDGEWYLSHYEDVAKANIEPLAHYLRHGRDEHRITSPFAGDRTIPRRWVGLFADMLPQDGKITFRSLFDVEPLSTSDKVIFSSHFKSAKTFHYADKISDASLANYPRAPYIARFENVGIIGGTRLVLPDANTILSDEISAFSGVEGATIRPHDFILDSDGRISFTLNRRYPSKLDRGINLMHEYAANYFHLITEVLPKLYLSDEMGVDSDIPILVQAGLGDNLKQLIKAVNRNNRHIIELEDRMFYKISEVYHPSDISSIQDVYDRKRLPSETLLHTQLIRDTVALLGKEFAPPKSENALGLKRRIFLRRGDRYRSLTNEPEVAEFLAENGFELLITDGLSIKAQVAIFRDAELVICPTGAAVTNMLWCRPGARFLVLMADHIATPGEIWTQLGEIAQCSVETVRCARAYARDGSYAMHDDYTVDMDVLRRLVGTFGDVMRDDKGVISERSAH